ncbi:MAG TPA: sigma-54-dependent Fis family transcriptional regulator [Rhodocyclaceae bacterium]|nr:sigma-54-dependent Fis family transcriptional regulator [Rhodocyclaceae bacterium]
MPQPVASSWQRSQAHGLSPEQALPDNVACHATLAERLEANARLLCFAQPIIENLHQQMASASSLVLLADREGFVLRTLGDPEFISRASRVALAPGASWDESIMGTNAIGTAAVEGRTVAIHGSQHFLERNRFLSCLATPIQAPTGGVLGIIDLTSDARAYQPFAQALLSTTAELIEHRLLIHMDGACFTLHFSQYPELVGSPLEALLQFGEDGRVLAANRRARLLLGEDAVRPGAPFERLFGCSWAQVEQQSLAFRAQVQLRTTDGRPVAARFEQRRPPRPPRPPPAPAPEPRRDAFEAMNHGDARMAAAIGRARRIAGRAIPLLIQGETGTGKELFARAFHLSGPRHQGPWVPVNCAAIPANLIESELFGHAPGAFTGARTKGARGKLVEADGGTLFLDEIGDMPLNLQAVLLRVLESRRVTPLGSSEEIPVDIALVCASHRSLAELVDDGLFRADLLFRLNGLTIWLPPLRERSDFDALARHLLAEETRERRVSFSPEALALLRRQGWHGNLRQLRNVLRVALALLDPEESTLTPEHIPADLLDPVDESAPGPAVAGGDLRAAENRLVRECVARHQGNLSAAARELGITRTTLYRKLRS